MEPLCAQYELLYRVRKPLYKRIDNKKQIIVAERFILESYANVQSLKFLGSVFHAITLDHHV